MYKNYLAHYGIFGMRWGVRRYQNRDGSLTPEGRKRLGLSDKGPRHTPSNSKKKAKERAANLEKARKAKAEKKEFEAKKKQALEKGSATEVLKYKGSLTNQELQAAYNRINLERQLSSIAASETKTAWDKLDKIVDRVGKAKNYAEKGIEVYNLFAKVHNSFADKDSQLKVIDGKSSEAKEADKKLTKIIRTGTADDIKKHLGELSGSQLEEAMRRLRYEDRLDETIAANQKALEEKNRKKNSK